jgi:excisionase family DNA binding protein
VEAQTERYLYTVEDAAQKLSVSRATLYKEIKRGAIKTVKIGRSARVSEGELANYVKSLEAA